VSTTRPTLAAATRTETGKANARLRHAGRIPAVVYGHGPSISVSVDAHELELLRRHAGANELVDVAIDGTQPAPVLLQKLQLDKVTRLPLHIDLFRVKMSEEMTVDVPVHLTGTSEVVERHGGTIIHALDHVRVRARPDRLPSALEADASVLATFESVILARELILPKGVALVTEPEEVVIRVLASRVSSDVAEDAAMAAAASAASTAAAEAAATGPAIGER